MNLNKVHLIGRVTKDPELKTLQTGLIIVSFGLATNNVFKDKQGQKKEETDFHNVTAFGKTAETITQYVIKGQELYVEGRIKYRSWDKQDGTKGYATNIICNTFQFGQKPNFAAKAPVVPARPIIQASDSQFEYSDRTLPPTPTTEQEMNSIGLYPPDEINMDEIPF